MSISNELIKKADSGDVGAQMSVANAIIWGDTGPIDPDWAKRALHYYESAAGKGNSDAMIEIGTMYRLGRGVDRDMDMAFKWLKKAADDLNPRAYQYLGYALEIPVGYQDINDDSDDYKTVFNYFFKGAMLNDPDSMYKIGDMYFSGKYVEKDQKFAFDMYWTSYHAFGEYESASLHLRLGECFCKGIGTEQDFDRAQEHLEIAIDTFERRIAGNEAPEFFMEGYNRAKLLLKRLNSNKFDIKSAEDDSDILQNKEFVKFINSDMMIYPKPEKSVKIEKLIEENPSLEPHEDISFCDALINAKSGDSSAMFALAFHCAHRIDKEVLDEQIVDFALYYYHEAVKKGHKGAMYNLGTIYSHGDYGVAVNHEKAYLLFSFSGISVAQGAIGVYYAKGEIVTQNYEMAFKCFARCALEKTKESYSSLNNLSRMYREGLYVEKDEKFAQHCKNLSMKAKKAVGEMWEYYERF